MKVRITRTGYTEHGVFGVLSLGEYPQYPFCVTLERPWMHNEPFISCIPTGAYTCSRVQSPKWGDTFEVMDVPGRTHILFHAGNRAIDSSGCILLAKYFGTINGDPAILVSKPTVEKFMKRVQGLDSFDLQIAALL